MSTLLKILLVATAYFAAGTLSSPLAIPPGYATAVWPPAGIALVAVLVFGYRVGPGVALGSFLTNLQSSLEADSQRTIEQAAMLAGCVAVGPLLQVWASAFTVRRFVGYPSALDRERDVLEFLALAGPLGSLIGASWGVTALVLAGAVPLHNCAFSWWTWWVGDTIGVVIFAPLLLILVGQPREAWRRRRLTLGAPLIVGFSAVVLLFARVSASEKERVDTEFAHRADWLTEALKRQTEDYGEVAQAAAAFYGVKRRLTCDVFETFANEMLTAHPEIAVLSWVARVAQSERQSYERSTAPIREQAADGSWVSAPAREEYYPVGCLAPPSAAAALGYDFASDPERALAMQRARDSREPTASAPVALAQSSGQGLVFLVASFSSDDAASSVLAGFFSIVVPTDVLFATALRGLNRGGLELEAFDQEERGKARLLYTELPDPAPGGLDKTLIVGGRRWRLHFVPSPAFVEEQRGWRPWIVLSGGLFLVGLLGALLLVITGRESRVAQAEAKYRDLYENSPAMYLSVDANSGRISGCNRTFELALGYSRSEILERPIADVYHPESVDAALAVYENLRTSGKDAETELVLRRKDGSPLEVNLTSSAVRDDTGSVVASRSVFRDISGRKQLERLRERDRFFQLSLDMVCIASKEGFFLEISPAFERVLGYKESELLAKPYLHFVHEDDRAATLGEMEKLRSGQPTIGFKNRYRHKDGTYRWLQWQVAPDQSGLVYGIARDITDEMRAENELRASEKRLRAGLDEREVMLQEIHHRVKNNLQVISSLINLQMRQLEDSSSKAALEECQRRVQTIALIHEQLYRSGDYARVPFSEYTKSLAENVFHAAGTSPSKVSLKLEVEDIRMAVDKAIPCGLILNELIANALKHAFPHDASGTLRVGLRQAGPREIELSVADDGVGLPVEFDTARARSLGMQLVTTLVSQLDGRLGIERQGGTTFRVTFPLESPR